MRIQELFITEATPAPAQPVAANPQGVDDPNASTDVRLATALKRLDDINKQMKTVQDGVALSMNQAGAPQQATPATQAPPAPGEAGQGQVAKGPTGPGQTTPPPAPGQQPELGQPNGAPMGQDPAQAQPGQTTPPPPAPPGISKPAPAIKQELLRQIAKNQ